MFDQKISENLDQLCNEEIRLESLGEHEPDFLVYMTQTIDEIYNKVAHFKPSIDNLDDTVIKFTLKDDSIKNIEDALSQSYQISMEHLKHDTGAQAAIIETITTPI